MDLDQSLMAYADGQLDASAAAAVERALDADPALRAVVASHRRLRQAVSGAFAGVLDEPVPGRLAGMLSGGERAVTAAARRSRPPRVRQLVGRVSARTARPRSLALGAAAAAAVAALWLAPRFDPAPAPFRSPGGAPPVAHLQRELSAELASAPDQHANIRIGLTFRSRAGEWCRTFTTAESRSRPAAGIACGRGGRWRVLVLEPLEPGPVGEFRTAGSELPSRVAASLDELIAGEPLGPEQERRARDSGWPIEQPRAPR